MLYSFKKSEVLSKSNRHNLWLIFLILTSPLRYLIRCIFPKKGLLFVIDTFIHNFDLCYFLTSVTVLEMEKPTVSEESVVLAKFNSHDKETIKKETKKSLQPPGHPSLKKRKSDHAGKIPEETFQVFFNVPIVKFWTSTLVYLGFLVLQAYLYSLIILL